MISTLLVEYSWAVPPAFGAFAVACVLAGTFLLRTRDGGRRVTIWLASLSALAVVPLTLLPEGGSPERFCTVRFAWPAWGAVETLANTALLFPAAFFFTLLTRRPATVAAVASAISALIEAAQALLPGIGRACDTTDWEMNSIGAVLGAVAAWLTHRATRPATVRD